MSRAEMSGKADVTFPISGSDSSLSLVQDECAREQQREADEPGAFEELRQYFRAASQEKTIRTACQTTTPASFSER
jgi:hypothetical protein